MLTSAPSSHSLAKIRVCFFVFLSSNDSSVPVVQSPLEVPLTIRRIREMARLKLDEGTSSTTQREDEIGSVTVQASSNSLHPYPVSWRLTAILLSLILGSLLVAIDTTIISVAIPSISTDFKALNDVGWYGSAYLLTLTAFQPTVGNVYKVFNLKTAYIVSIVIFEGLYRHFAGTCFQISSITTDSRFSWINNMRHSAKFNGLHRRASYRRHGSRRAYTRSIGNCHIYCSLRKEADVHRHGGERVWNQRLWWPYPWGRSYRPYWLEMGMEMHQRLAKLFLLIRLVLLH